MADRGILFSGEMVAAILAGKKTQTRRVLRDPLLRGNACPHGRPGDRLWVRETWSPGFAIDDAVGGDPERTIYRATNTGPEPLRWVSPLFMPRTRARIVLAIREVRVEQLQAIAQEDALAEGVAGVDAFRALWDRISAKRGLGWEKNPWVWVLRFEVVR